MNSEEFIKYYNLIDNYLRKTEGRKSLDSFSFVVKNSTSAAVRCYGSELITFGNLRNAIVHNPTYGNRPIAEPHDEVVNRIKFIYSAITKPLMVSPEFNREVLGAREDDFINAIIIEMRKRSISQFPVFNQSGAIIELISTNTISRWLSTQIEEKGTIMVENIKIQHLLKEIEFPNNYKFISQNTSIFEAFELFVEHIKKEKKNLDALFITFSGKQNEKLLGLVTIEDIATKVKLYSS